VSLALVLLFTLVPREGYRGHELAQRLDEIVRSWFEDPSEENDGPQALLYPDAGGELVYKACPNGCTFFEDEERERYLTEAVRACVERHKQSK